jgi:hypothetical protein
MLPALAVSDALVFAELGLAADVAGKAAASALRAALSASVTEPPGSTVAGEEVAVTPEGSSPMLTVTGALPLPPIATLRVCVLPGYTVRELTAGVTVNVVPGLVVEPVFELLAAPEEVVAVTPQPVSVASCRQARKVQPLGEKR